MKFVSALRHNINIFAFLAAGLGYFSSGIL